MGEKFKAPVENENDDDKEATPESVNYGEIPKSLIQNLNNYYRLLDP